MGGWTVRARAAIKRTHWLSVYQQVYVPLVNASIQSAIDGGLVLKASRRSTLAVETFRCGWIAMLRPVVWWYF